MRRVPYCAWLAGIGMVLLASANHAAEDPSQPAARSEMLAGLRGFYAKTARPDGSFQPGIDPDYLGMSDSAYSDLAAVTYACTIHKTFGWQLPNEEKTIAFLQSRQKPTGEFFNVAGTVDPGSPEGRVYNTTQALVALHALGVQPKHDPLPVFEAILRQDYKTLPAYSTSFFPLAYLCAGKPIPEQADRAIRALMVQDDDGYLNDHIAATFHASHYYALVGDPTPKAAQMVARVLRDQKADGSWLLNLPARDRHATFDAVFTLRQEGGAQTESRAAIERAGQWALSCRNPDGGFGHYPGSTSDADAVYFQVGTLVMADSLSPSDPPTPKPELLSWGHLMPVRKRPAGPDEVRLSLPGWVGNVALGSDGQQLATGTSDGKVRIWDSQSGELIKTLSGHSDRVASVAFSPDDELLVTGGYDQTAKIWHVSSGQVRAALTGHRGAVLSVAFAPGGAMIATGSIDGDVALWEVRTATRLHSLQGHQSWVNSVAFSPSGNRIISGSSDGTLRVWSASTGELERTIRASKAEVRAVAFSSDGKAVAAGIRYGTVKIWDTEDWTLTRTLEFGGDDVNALTFHPQNGQLLVATGQWNRPGQVETWDVAAGKSVDQHRHTGEILGIAVSSDGKVIAVGGADHAASIWHVGSAAAARQ